MKNNTILNNYQDWLEHHKMPAGKKKTLVAAIELFSQQGYNGTQLPKLQKRLELAKQRFLNILKPKVTSYQKLCSL